MPDISKNALSTGAISMSDVNIRIGRSSNATTSLNETIVRKLFRDESGQISMSTGRGKFQPYGSRVSEHRDQTDYSGQSGNRTFNNVSFGTDTDDRIIVCTYGTLMTGGSRSNYPHNDINWNVGNHLQYFGEGSYAVECMSSATIGGVAATPILTHPFYEIGINSGSQPFYAYSMTTFYARPSGTSGTVSVSFDNNGWGGTYIEGLLHVYALYGLSTGNPVEDAVTTQDTTNSAATKNLQITLNSGTTDYNDKLLLLIGGRGRYSVSGSNDFYVGGSNVGYDHSTGSDEGGIISYLTNSVPSGSFTANCSMIDSTAGSDGTQQFFGGIVFRRDVDSGDTASFQTTGNFQPYHAYHT